MSYGTFGSSKIASSESELSSSMRSESSGESSGFWWGSSSSGSSGSEPSSGSDSLPSSGSSGSVNDSGSIGSSDSIGSSGMSESSGFCSWLIRDITYVANDEMTFIIENTGTVTITFTGIWTAVDPSMASTGIAPAVAPRFPGASFTVAPGATQAVGVTMPGNDLRNVEFYVDGTCGMLISSFPYS